MEWLYLPHQISMGISGSFHKKERWEFMPMCQFLCTQQSHREGPLSAPSHHRSAQCSRTHQDIYENRFETCIPPCTHCRGRQTQNGILNPLWIIRMESYALWPFQCSSSLSTIHQ